MSPQTLPPRGSGDAELDALFAADPGLAETARRVRAAAPEPPAADAFRARLRAQLMAEAEARPLPRKATPGMARPERAAAEVVALPGSASRRWWRRRGGTLPALIAGGSGLALVAATVLLVVINPGTPGVNTPTFSAPIANVHDVPTAQAIEVSFDQPMDQQAVVAGLHIEPATAVTTTWRGNTLVITPVHPLAANTAYTVTIDKGHARTTAGATAPEPVRFSFGTQATPPPAAPTTPQAPATLNPTLLATIANPVIAGFAPDGSPVVAGTMTPPAGVTPSAAPSPSAGSAAANTATPAASPAATPAQAQTPAPAAVTGTYVFGATGPVQIGPAAVVAFAPDGMHLALGGADGSVVIADAGGANAQTVATLGAPVAALVWTASDHLDAVTAAHIDSVATGAAAPAQQIAAAPAGAAFTGISPNGRFAVLTRADAVSVVDLSDGKATVLKGAAGVAWSADSTTVAWMQNGALRVAPAGSLDKAVTLPVPAGITTVAALAVSHDGAEIGVVGGNGSVRLLDASSGTVLATLDAQATALTFVPGGGSVLLVLTASDGSTGVYAAPAQAPPAPQSNVPAGAVTTANAFVDAQVHGNSGAISALAGKGVKTAQTPAGLSRAYVIDIARSGAAVIAHARLLIDPSGASGVVRYADETITISATPGGTFLVSALSVGPLNDESTGPHVVHVGASRNAAVITVTFDSDLDAATLGSAITVTTHDGTALPATVTYDSTSRTATVTLATAPTAPVTLTVAPSLLDISEQSMTAAYSVTLAG